ncbi:MAG: hydrogenase 3 maturation endopeptidase HyCI [Candidatus Bathyarchaeota archaeon]|nr:hydrogenase 3 maturation endopeptidase HyCI [Candidatus Bathyarchaeota archaeon]
MKHAEIETQLKDWFKDASFVVVAGIGNEIRRDDFLGVKIVKDLEGKVSSKVHLIECETVPESFMDEIIALKPSHVLLVDAALLQLEPGEAQLFDSEKVTSFPAISTHMLPLRMFCEYITQLTGGKLSLLLMQPKDTDFGEGLTPEVEACASQLAKILLNVLP